MNLLVMILRFICIIFIDLVYIVTDVIEKVIAG